MAKDRVIEWDQTAGWRNWSLGDFVAWHRGLVKHFGEEKTLQGYPKADTVFAVFWVASEGPNMLKTKALVATPSLFKDEIAYLEKQPALYKLLNLETVLKLKKVNPVDLAAQGIQTSVTTVENIVGAVGAAGKIIRVAIPLALAFSFILAGIWAYKKYGK